MNKLGAATVLQQAYAAERERLPRFRSHAIVELRPYGFWPFSVRSGLLLDVSMQGLKAELTAPYPVRVGATYMIDIPLAPLGIYAGKRLRCHLLCRWFEAQRMRLGGEFVHLRGRQREIVQQVIASLQGQSQRSPRRF